MLGSSAGLQRTIERLSLSLKSTRKIVPESQKVLLAANIGSQKKERLRNQYGMWIIL
jgi:hypothetical protein